MDKKLKHKDVTMEVAVSIQQPLQSQGCPHPQPCAMPINSKLRSSSKRNISSTLTIARAGHVITTGTYIDCTKSKPMQLL